MGGEGNSLRSPLPADTKPFYTITKHPPAHCCARMRRWGGREGECFAQHFITLYAELNGAGCSWKMNTLALHSRGQPGRVTTSSREQLG